MVEKQAIAYSTKELGPDTWPDFERLARKQGSCWCMYYQRPKPIRGNVSKEERRAMNKKDKETLVRQGRSHAILVYDGRTPVGWCQYGPREELPRIDAGRNYERLVALKNKYDPTNFYRKVEPPSLDKKLWRITCFFVDKEYRRKGVARTALKAALESIKKAGGGIVEAYPVVSKKFTSNPDWMWFGSPSMFRREGFKPVAPLGTSYSLMRRNILED